MLEGIINLDKPVGITSAKAVYRVRSITGQRKSGHAGTLDPGASGVLVVCLGKATKLVEAIMNQPKVYRATARLDVTSESFDSDRPLVPVAVAAPPSKDSVQDVLLSFVGRIEHVPPRISAVKIGGRPAYRRAMSNEPFVVRPRFVQIHWIELRAYDFPHAEFEVCCGRGTYIRALIRDLGERLQTGGCLTSLVRLRVGPFCQADSWTFDALAAARDPQQYVVGMNRVVDLLDPARIEIPPRGPA